MTILEIPLNKIPDGMDPVRYKNQVQTKLKGLGIDKVQIKNKISDPRDVEILKPSQASEALKTIFKNLSKIFR